jgi:hypothetical protein
MNKFQRQAKQIIDDLRRNQSSYDQSTIDRALNVLARLKEKIKEVEKPISIPKNVDLLYMLAGGKPQAFLDYMKQYPSDEIRDIARSPQQFQQIFNKLKSQVTPMPGQKDGIPQADLQSSNVYGYQYDPESGALKVRFQNGGIYEYDDVPPFIYNLFAKGSIPAKTDGYNEYGVWWEGKQPSLGASMYDLIRKGGFNYRKVA